MNYESVKNNIPERSEGWSRRRFLLLHFRFRYTKAQRKTNVLRLLEKYDKRTTQRPTQIYSQRKSPDSPGGFEFERTRKTNK